MEPIWLAKYSSEESMKKLKRGTQILYIPSHINVVSDEYIGYPSGIQPGFVTSGPNEHGEYFCRYWRIGVKGGVKGAIPQLRTVANSELTPVANIMVKDTMSQEIVEKALEMYC